MPRSNEMLKPPNWWGKDFNGSLRADENTFNVDRNDPTFRPPSIGTAPSSMVVSPEGETYIRSWEKGPAGGAALKAYPSVEAGADTIGWGHKIKPGENFSRGLTGDKAENLFQQDIAAHQRFVQQNVKVPLAQHQFDALTSLSYTSPRALQKSGLLEKLNSGDYAGAADEILQWDHAADGKGGKMRVPGLTDRRKREWEMFSHGIYANHK